MLSELHQGVLSDLLTEALGVGWEGRERHHSEHRRFEILGAPEALMAEFTRRAGEVENVPRRRPPSTLLGGGGRSVRDTAP